MLKSCRHFLSPLCRDTLGTRSSSPWFGVRSVGKGCCCELLTRTCSVRMPRIVSASFFLLSAGLKSPGRESESILLTRSSTILSIASRSCPPGGDIFSKATAIRSAFSSSRRNSSNSSVSYRLTKITSLLVPVLDDPGDDHQPENQLAYIPENSHH